MVKKTWAQKMLKPAEPQLTTLDKPYGKFVPGQLMLIPTPSLIQDFILSTPKGETRTVEQFRQTLAKEQRADVSCPLTTGIFLRIVCEAALDQLNFENSPLDKITPFWRVVDPKTPLAKKLSCGPEWIVAIREAESKT